MPKFVAHMALPETWNDVVEEILGVGAIINLDDCINRGRFDIEFEEDDMYDLAVTVQELQNTLNSILGYASVTITKPVPV